MTVDQAQAWLDFVKDAGPWVIDIVLGVGLVVVWRAWKDDRDKIWRVANHAREVLHEHQD